MIRTSLAIANAVSALLIFLVTAIFIPTFDMSFYRAEYAKQNTYARIGVSEEGLMSATERLTDYMRGRADDLDITVEVNGVRREFYNAREKAHMVDVKALFTAARTALIASVCVYVSTALALRGQLRLMSRAGIGVMLVFTVLVAGFAGVVALDFDRAWTRFHLVFFSNDLWQLDPSTSLLINIVPLEFFIDISLRVGMIFGGLLVGYALALAALRKLLLGDDHADPAA